MDWDSDATLFILNTRRQVLETQCFTDQLAAIGPLPRMDEAIAAVQLILTENAEVFPLLRNFKSTRLAKTKAVGGLPALNIWYSIEEEAAQVLLLYVEPIPE